MSRMVGSLPVLTRNRSVFIKPILTTPPSALGGNRFPQPLRQIHGARTVLRGFVVRVRQQTRLQREAATTDARVQAVAQRDKRIDLTIETLPPGAGYLRPVRARRCP